MPPRVFLLSPAFCGGRRAAILLNPASKMALAGKLAEGTLTLGEAFSFMSGLYFRGKLAYAQRFGSQVFVITPTRGLQQPDVSVSTKLLREFAAVDVDADDARYRRPLDRDLRRLARQTDSETPVVLLGSIATGKYVDPLTASLGERLHYPLSFAGRGDMSRGGLMLRSVAAEEELEYISLAAGGPRHGARPPKLPPAKPVPPRSGPSDEVGPPPAPSLLVLGVPEVRMAQCEVCGNDYDKAFQVVRGGKTHTFDSFECAIHALAPTCAHCGCRVIGHGMEASGTFYCCAHCARHSGVRGVDDRV